ncbi:MAG: kinase [Planctomycetaceae bacterium]|nr:kinase [Planctomycetaceae bacterium]
MELPELIDALSRPEAYPFPVEAVEVRQTHISAVFLVGEYVYKLKKPVAPGFLDFTTLDRRLYFCCEEVRLNRRLAPDVYLSVVPIVETSEGIRIEGVGEIIEWAVKMRRLPDSATLLKLVKSDSVAVGLIESLALRIAAFHHAAESGKRITAFTRFDVVARNFREVFERALPCVGNTVSRSVFDRIHSLAEESLTRLQPLIESRTSRGVARDGHGDLHLDHIYFFPDQPAPGDLVIIDCIEFNEQYRFLDPIADMAFAVMDFAFQGRRDLAEHLAKTYFVAADDAEGLLLLPFYTAYRAAIRGMVEGLLSTEPEVPETERTAAVTRARAHWLLALTELESPGHRPCLLLVTGLPGSGKSTLARTLGERAGFEVIRSDVLRKELAGLPTQEPTPPETRESLYTQATTDRVYAECLRHAEQAIHEGRRALVDATFRAEWERIAFIYAAIECGVPVAILNCEATPETIRLRLESRKGDVSDADWAVHLQVAKGWEEPGETVRRVFHTVSTEGNEEAVLARAIDILRRMGLASD